jgi:hypothetical protein
MVEFEEDFEDDSHHTDRVERGISNTTTGNKPVSCTIILELVIDQGPYGLVGALLEQEEDWAKEVLTKYSKIRSDFMQALDTTGTYLGMCPTRDKFHDN